MAEFDFLGRYLPGLQGDDFFLLAGNLEAHDLAGPPERRQLARQGAVPYVPRTYPVLDQSGPSIGPCLSQQPHNIAVVVAGIRGTHLEQPIAAGLADHQRALQHALAQGAGGGGILGGLGGLFACLHHRGFSQVLSILRTLQIFDFGRDF